MAAAVAEQVWRDSAPEAVEGELSALWRDVGRRGPIARAVMSNLVVLRAAGHGSADADGFLEDRSIDAVAAQHPSRVLIIEHSPAAEDMGGTLRVRVGIVTFGPPQARYGVEQIAVRSLCGDRSLPSLVRRFVRGGLPISLWYREDLSSRPPIAPIAALARQFVYDSRQWRDVRQGILSLADWLHADLADINWRRLEPMRRALVFAAKVAETDAWQPENIRIAYRSGESALAWLLVGWLASRLEWPPAAAPNVHEASDGDTRLSVSIGNGSDQVIATLEARCAIVKHRTGAPSIVGFRDEGEADAVAAELHMLSRDVCLHDALSALLHHFSAA